VHDALRSAKPSNASWVMLADPEGNEFCLLARPVREAVESH
jgi:hypothetical protein